METLDRIPFETQKKIFKRLAEVADSSHLCKADREKYEESQRVVDNYNLGMYSAWVQGNKKGKIEGKLEGKLEGKQDDAKRFLAMGLSPEQVAEGTQLPLEQVLVLAGRA